MLQLLQGFWTYQVMYCPLSLGRESPNDSHSPYLPQACMLRREQQQEQQQAQWPLDDLASFMATPLNIFDARRLANFRGAVCQAEAVTESGTASLCCRCSHGHDGGIQRSEVGRSPLGTMRWSFVQLH